ncbi:beta-lactamase [Halalkaliarchaeum desulfuricum]|uniref:Beta-lactamase n=1 Tax=Halalkaliarchaeum desulfuricum TaxID=2055893 RepID=A0A343TMJ7_9EURY|nr:serine hydrolase [Halalkaliarchaeum desulfuricum]AUX10319.1 beta-lactamase [Halalkaliarchaeum desulfuricum]
MADLSTDTEREIASFVREWMAEANVPGASIAITDRDEVVYADGFGSRDLASNAPATPSTLYGFGSVTKSFTALAVLQGVEKGWFDLSDSIAEHTPAEFDGAGEVTLHQLLTHSSGVPSLGTSEVLIARQGGAGEHGIPLGDMDDVYAHVDGAERERDAHSEGRFMYNNEAYVLLADAVERESGRRFAEYVDSEIFAPLGMDRSRLLSDSLPGLDTDDEDAPDVMTPYRPGEDAPEEASLPVRELSHGPGGLFGTVEELAAYLRYHLSGGEPLPDGSQLVDPDLLARAHEGHVETPSGPYGYGWRTRKIAGTQLVGHGGSIMVSTAYVGFLPEEGLGVAIACNIGARPHPTQVAEGIVATLQGEDPADVVPYYTYHDSIDPLVGSYEAYAGIREATVEERDGVLWVTLENGIDERTVALVPENLEEWQFRTRTRGGRQSTVEFVETDDGIDLFLERLRLHQA